MDMISNEILRDLNIKRTFMGVDMVQSYPVDMVKLTIKHELYNSKLQEIDRGTQYDLREWFINPTLIPNIPLIERHIILYQKLPVFILKSSNSMMCFLVSNVI